MKMTGLVKLYVEFEADDLEGAARHLSDVVSVRGDVFSREHFAVVSKDVSVEVAAPAPAPRPDFAALLRELMDRFAPAAPADFVIDAFPSDESLS